MLPTRTADTKFYFFEDNIVYIFVFLYLTKFNFQSFKAKMVSINSTFMSLDRIDFLQASALFTFDQS